MFAAAYAELPDMEQDIEAAKALVADAGIEGQTITIGMSSELANTALQAAAYQAAAEAIGLKAELKSVSAANYINFFIDAEFREDVDGWFTVNYGDYADPTALLATLVMSDGSQNYSGYENPEVTRLMNEARSTADPDERAQKVADAQAIIMEDMPWIPTTFPSSVLITNSNLSGTVASFAYMFAPWANDLGGVG